MTSFLASRWLLNAAGALCLLSVMLSACAPGAGVPETEARTRTPVPADEPGSAAGFETQQSVTTVNPRVEAPGAEAQSPEKGQPAVGLYDLFETRVENPKTYPNPFDFNEIDLRAIFYSPSGRQIDFFGFYDGDGDGGQRGNVWKLRFMPDEVGGWTYSCAWSDGTPCLPGRFTVIDTGLPGPLQVAADNSWYFMDARGEPFHWRGYDLHVAAAYSPSRSIVEDLDWFKSQIQRTVIDRGYNFTMWDGLIDRKDENDSNIWDESWWLDAEDTRTFNLPAWHAWEEALRLAKDNRVYVIPFAGMIYQGHEYGFSDFQVFLRYWTARLGPFYNFMGWSPTWEWTDIWSADEVDQIMRYLHEINPFPTLLSVHDCSHTRFTAWLSFSMRQAPSKALHDGNSRLAGMRQGSCDAEGGVGESFLDLPIIGSEDIWETKTGGLGHAQNADELRRAAWGIMMAGVLPLYSEWHPIPPQSGGEGVAEPEVRRMFDFLYTQTRYRRYQQLTQIVSGDGLQVAAGIPGEEYLIYIQEGRSPALNLSGLPADKSFTASWFDPQANRTHEAGMVQAGMPEELAPPFSGDSVLLLVANDELK